ncbi:MAG: dihydrodipicolinate synthase family protein [Candidatus Tectomicrobia bacterium]|nr:dihydrodipicolinate synthase family protein [Candidatus Tectomicrobia bacterium]
MVKPVNVRGIIPATVLPMTKDYRMDPASMKCYYEWLIDQGVCAVAVNADTGEGPHLYPEEKRRVLEKVVEIVSSRVSVIAGLTAAFTDQAVRQAKEAEAIGADGLLMFPIPAFRGKPQDAGQVYAYHAAIADAVDLPMILFQLQDALGGVEFEVETLLRLSAIENVVAVKEASFDALKFVRTVAVLGAGPRPITILTGNDNFICESFILGAKGALIGFGTVATSLQVEAFHAAMENDFARVMEIGRKIQPLVDATFGPPVRNYRARLKEVLVMQGVIERATVRPPLMPVPDAERAAIRKALEAMELLPARA